MNGLITVRFTEAERNALVRFLEEFAGMVDEDDFPVLESALEVLDPREDS